MYWKEILKSARRKLKFKIFKQAIIEAANEQNGEFLLDDIYKQVSELYVQKHKEEFGHLKGTNTKNIVKTVENNSSTMGSVLKNNGFTSRRTRVGGMNKSLYRRIDAE